MSYGLWSVFFCISLTFDPYTYPPLQDPEEAVPMSQLAAGASAWLCVCVCVSLSLSLSHIHYIYIYIYIYISNPISIARKTPYTTIATGCSFPSDDAGVFRAGDAMKLRALLGFPNPTSKEEEEVMMEYIC